jgi:hypothetical protein
MHRVKGGKSRLLREDLTDAADIGAWSFWPYTVATLGSVVAMGSALALSGLHRRLGRAVAGAATLGLVLLPVLRDWPPFVSYLITMVLGVGVTAGKEHRGQG